MTNDYSKRKDPIGSSGYYPGTGILPTNQSPTPPQNGSRPHGESGLINYSKTSSAQYYKTVDVKIFFDSGIKLYKNNQLEPLRSTYNSSKLRETVFTKLKVMKDFLKASNATDIILENLNNFELYMETRESGKAKYGEWIIANGRSSVVWLPKNAELVLSALVE